METSQALQQQENLAKSEELFEQRYRFVLRETASALREVGHYSSFDQILSLRMVGLLLMVLALLLKVLGFNQSLLTTSEFMMVFLVGTLLMILGSYFRAKHNEGERSVVRKTGEALVNRFQAHTGLLNAKPAPTPENSPEVEPG